MSNLKKVMIIMGSDSDYPVMKDAISTLKEFSIPFEAHVSSAHRTPERTSQLAAKAIENDFGVIIAGAGAAAHLAGFLAAHTTLPILAVPLNATALNGIDALLASVQMPAGIPVACMAVGGAKNAALMAIEILAISDPELSKMLLNFRSEMKDKVMSKNTALQEKIKNNS